jgi:hypothetical protein
MENKGKNREDARQLSTRKFSFSVGTGMEDSLLPGIVGRVSGGDTELYCAYVASPFRLLMDDRAARAEKERALAGKAALLLSLGVEPVLAYDYTCFGDRHLTLSFQEKFARMLDFARSCGIKGVLLSELYLAGTLSANVPPYSRLRGFDAYISHRARISCAARLDFLKDVPVRQITLHPGALVDEEELERMVEAAGLSRLEAPLNCGCPPLCPLETLCRASLFHLLEEPPLPGENDSLQSYYQDRCREMRQGEPAVAGHPFVILPSRLGVYLSAGISRFRVFNDPQSAEDLERKLTPYVLGQDPGDPLSLACLDC